ncbi:MAG TPA: lysophospholipid acyltransferase family protein [Caulobacteraceae bacterium]|nr:lysophospholipid acyltransferase family protein [Caulobacteraceae bacterium]
MAKPRPSRLQDLLWRLEAVGFDLFTALMRALPVDAASAAGGWLLKTLGPLTGTHKTAARNLMLAFPDKDRVWHDRVLAAQWESTGRAFAEFPIMDRLRPSTGRVEVVNGERLEQIAREGRAVVFISGHFSNWEVMPATIVESGVTCLMTYRAANNPYVDRRIKEGRFRYGVRLFAPKGDSARELMEAMGRGESIALMNDQKFNQGLAGTFFGHPVHTAPGPTRLALKFATVLQPMSVQRTRGARFRVIVHDPIELEVTGDRAADIEAGVRRVNAFMEERVRERPEEWFWVHKRWANEAYAGLA